MVYNKKPNGLGFELTGMQALPDTFSFSTKQFKKWVQKHTKIFTINVHEPINELANKNGLNEMVGKLLEKYFNVFPVELPILPPTREVDHAIELMSDVKPISRSSYWFSFAKYEKLRQQLSDFLNKGYIKPNKTPWDAPMLFVKKKDGTSRLRVNLLS